MFGLNGSSWRRRLEAMMAEFEAQRFRLETCPICLIRYKVPYNSTRTGPCDMETMVTRMHLGPYA